jgi:hypothetical protein
VVIGPERLEQLFEQRLPCRGELLGAPLESTTM